MLPIPFCIVFFYFYQKKVGKKVTEENQSIISFKQVNKVYPNGVHGLRNLNIDIKKGEFVIVVGLSGAGKSTMLRALIVCMKFQVVKY